MDPEEFQRLAARLLRDGGPATCRSAISRAYYAAFNVALDLLDSNGFQVAKTENAHKQVSRHLLAVSDPAVRSVGSQLDSMRAIRNKADYDMKDLKSEDRKTADFWVKEAKAYIVTLRSAFNGPDRDTIIANIRDWKRMIDAAGGGS